MRMRRRKWTDEELSKCEFYIKKPELLKGKWCDTFFKKQPIHLELGCGKGTFIANLALKNQNINYIAIDMIDTMLGFAKRNIEKLYRENCKDIQNVLLVRYDIERILEVIGETDYIQRIYINFCNPWQKPKHNKKRLTHIKQLELYKKFLVRKGEIHFKTDNDELFKGTLKYFESSGFKIIKKTEDLYIEKWEDNVTTEHEEMFSKQGIKIKALISCLDDI